MIREMNSGDIPTILDMGYEMYSTTSYQDTEWCPLKVAQLCINLVREPYMQAWIAEVDGEPVGMFFGLIQEHYFGPTVKSCDLLLYVKPENRGGSHAIKMVKAYIDWALAFGVAKEQVGVGVTTGVCDEQVDRLYTKMGFVKTGQLYKLR